MNMITVRTCIRRRRSWSKPEEKRISCEDAARLYRWSYDHPTFQAQYQAAKVGQEVLVNLFGTITELCNVWKLAGLTDEQINQLNFWKK